VAEVKAILTLGIFWLAIFLSGCSRASPNAAAARAVGFAVPVETVTAALERVEEKIAAVGTVEPNEIVSVRSEIEGRIVEVHFQEGAAVRRGDLLFRLDDAKLRAELQLAQARYEKARNNLERSRTLLEQKAISPQEFDDARAEFKMAEAALVLARERLADATIRSPLDGHISERLVSPQQYVEKNQTLVIVVDLDPMKIDFSVPERYLPQLHAGQTVYVRVPAMPQRVFTGEVYFIDPRVQPSTRTVKLKALIANPRGELRPGLFASVELVAGVREQAVMVPEQAVVPAIDSLTVFVVKDGVAHRRKVRLGARMPGKVEVLEGISAGEEVVVAGQQKLRDQMPVKPVG
jgi:membrane fusion protein (multidrug efflux system)